MIKKLPGNKATALNDIPVSVLKESISAYHEKLTDIFNNCIGSGTFPEILKKAEVIPVFKKGGLTSKKDYCRVSFWKKLVFGKTTALNTHYLK